jgi:tryptophanyl-tRNA synthetase
MKKFIVIVVMFLIMVGVAQAESTNLTNEKEDILKLIQLLEENPLRNSAMDLRTKILRYGMNSKEGLITLDSKFAKIAALDYIFSKEMSFQYIAGCIKFDILNPDLAFDEKADIVSGVESIIIAYSNILIKKPQETNSFLDSLVSLKNNNQLTLENIEQKFKE